MPRVPDFDDGVIDQTDYIANNVFAIVGYRGMQVGDIIRLYWDNSELPDSVRVDSTILTTGVAVFSIEDKYLVSGSHNLSYRVTDLAGNALSSEILVLYVTAETVIKALPAPEIAGLTGQCLSRENIERDKGATVVIPAAGAGLSAYKGETLVINWTSYDINNRPVTGGFLSVSVLLDDNVVNNGISRLIPDTVVGAEGATGAFIYYYIERSSERLLSGMQILVTGDCNAGATVLNVTSDVTVIHSDGQDKATLTATVTDGQGQALAGQLVTWSCDFGTVAPVRAFTDSEGKASTGFTDNQSGDATVTATLLNGSQQAITLIVTAEARLSPPVFLDADGNIIYLDEIRDVITLRIRYEGMREGDSITVHTRGNDSEGAAVSGAAGTQNGTVSSVNIATGYIDLTLPTSYLQAVGDGGTFSAFYTVSTGARPPNKSETATIVSSKGVHYPLRCYLTTNAAIVARSELALEPMNRGLIMGAPGISVTVTCSAGGTVVESGKMTYTVLLDEAGQATFGLQSETPGKLSVNVVQDDLPANSWAGSSIISQYTDGSGDFRALNFSTGAVADGKMPCSVYVVVWSPAVITSVQVSIEGNASILGYEGQDPVVIPLNTDGSAKMDIVSSVAGDIVAELSLPQRPGNLEQATLHFIAAD